MKKKYLTSPISYDRLQRIEGSEYPFEAVREVLLNAIVHRNYSGGPIQISVYDDKFVVWNEGTLPEGLTIEDLKKKHPSRPRNPRLADVFFKGGLIEAWGRGTIKIINECINLGLPEPEIEIVGGGISVTLFKDKYTENYLNSLGLNKRQINAILFIKDKIKITNKEYQELFDISRNTASRDLQELVDKHIIKSSGTKGAGSYYELV